MAHESLHYLKPSFLYLLVQRSVSPSLSWAALQLQKHSACSLAFCYFTTLPLSSQCFLYLLFCVCVFFWLLEEYLFIFENSSYGSLNNVSLCTFSSQGGRRSLFSLLIRFSWWKETIPLANTLLFTGMSLCLCQGVNFLITSSFLYLQIPDYYLGNLYLKCILLILFSKYPSISK